MNEFLLILTWLAPLLLAPFGRHYAGRWLVPTASLPALLTVLVTPTGAQLEVPWLMLGAQFGLDAHGQGVYGIGLAIAPPADFQARSGS